MKSISKSMVLVISLATILSSLAIPLSTTKARSVLSRSSVSLSLGIAPYVGLSLVSNTANSGAGVTYENSSYSKTMSNGESIDNFGTTRLRVICNFASNNNATFYEGRDCKTNGWSLNVSPGPESVVNVKGSDYAAMVSEHSDYILSDSTSMNGQKSTWLLKVSPVTKVVNNVSISATVASGFGVPHMIPSTTTPIATSSSWHMINGTSTYVNSLDVDIQYGISVSPTQSAGTYTGVIDYTVSLNAKS